MTRIEWLPIVFFIQKCHYIYFCYITTFDVHTFFFFFRWHERYNCKNQCFRYRNPKDRHAILIFIVYSLWTFNCSVEWNRKLSANGIHLILILPIFMVLIWKCIYCHIVVADNISRLRLFLFQLLVIDSNSTVLCPSISISIPSFTWPHTLNAHCR